MKIDVFFGNPLLREIAVGWLHAFEDLGVDAVGVSPRHYDLPYRHPDVVVVVWPYSFDLNHFERYRLARKVLITTDDPFEIDHSEVLAKNFDLVVTHESASIGVYSNAVHLPFAFDHHLEAGKLPSDDEMRYDVCFFGGLYPPRREFLHALQAAGLRCITSLGRSRRVSFEDYYALARQSRINLNFHRHPVAEDYDHCSNRRGIPATSLNSRFFTLGGLKCFQLLFANREFPDAIRKDQVFGTPAEMIARIKWFLTQPNARTECSDALSKQINQKDRYIDRVPRLLEILAHQPDPVRAVVDLHAVCHAKAVLRPYFDDFSSWVGSLRH